MQGGYPPPYGQPLYSQPLYGQPPYGPMWGPAAAGYGAEPQYAGFWIRVVAYLIDSVIYSTALFFSVLAMFLLVGFILFPLIAFGYFPYFWSKSGATPGMQMLGLRVVRARDGGPLDFGTAFVRLIGFWINGMVCDLGFIWVAFEPRKRGWHDMIADTVVIHAN